MMAIENCRSEKATAKEQERAALPRVIAHKRHGARDECQ